MDPERFDPAAPLVERRGQGSWRFPIDRLSTRENALPPAEMWSGPEVSPEALAVTRGVAAAFEAIAAFAVVAFELGVDERGDFIEVRTGTSNRQVIEHYSRMKHGDIDAVSFFAGHLAAKTMQSERFISFNRSAMASERVIYMTTAAVFNVPSASNLLLKTTAWQLNIMLARQGLAPVIIAEQTRLSESPLGYASKSVRERRSELDAGRGVTIVPGNFRGQSVIFLDDLFNSGSTIDRAKARLQHIDAAETFYLFAARIDPRVVGATAGAVEDRLNDAYVGCSLASLAPMLQRGTFAVVQKLLRVVLSPHHTEQLPAFLQEVPTPAILKLYAAAASDGFRQRHQRRYLPAMLVLETVLQERGALDAEGLIIGAPVDLAALHV